VERGHLYIAQPPLYRVARGKSELYLKDDEALKDYLLRNAMEGLEIHGGDGFIFRGEDLGQVVTAARHYVASLDRLSRHCDRLALTVAAWDVALDLQVLENEVSTEQARHKLEERLRVRCGAQDRLELWTIKDVESGTREIHIKRLSSGVLYQSTLNAQLVQSVEFREMLRLAENLRNKLGSEPVARRGEREVAIRGAEHMMEWLLADGRRGQTMQRYKGLGEMNPAQLWETTMDPKIRTLLQVRVEDAVNADLVFTTLMGDAVEPRRDFIQENALNAANLDI
ncbi:MAG: DNA gyrase subunit B, partial [Magnetococcales bacterium]|nr:DNA gyrase subunit B [Magnetococcales bacterium]